MTKLKHRPTCTKGVGDREAVAGGPTIVALSRLADPAVLVTDVEHVAMGM